MLLHQLKILEVCSEIGAGTRGASLGLAAMKIAALNLGNNYFNIYPSVAIPNKNDLLFEPVQQPYAKRIAGVLTMLERISEEIAKTLCNNQFPIMLSGDHSTAAGTISGIKKIFPKSKLGVIWIDAHADIHSPYTTPSGNMHGMPLAIVLNEDNLECKTNKPDQETIAYWHQLKNLFGLAPKIEYKDLVYVAVRDTESQEDHLLKKNNVRNFTSMNVRRNGTAQTARDALQLLDHCDHIYVSFDVDSMDSSVSTGTGTPVGNGITEQEAGTLIAQLMTSNKICCFEIVEVNPTLDSRNMMAQHAFEILMSATNSLMKNGHIS